ncbi:MAG: hypothetical protein Q7J72_00495 [Candidatus Omnitrophota bacterium]|nr:hypothetical protein [Candidatus Omnitrophota bacterium]
MRRKFISLFLTASLLFQQTGFIYALGELDISSYLNRLSGVVTQDNFRPLHMRYFSYDAQNNDFNLLLDKGDEKELKDKELKDKTDKLLEYFKIGLTLPNDKFWVNLRPDAEDQIIDPDLEKTDIGKILLEADLQLKKDTAGFTSPQTAEGKQYWDKLYKKAGELFGSENITIPTITRPWIVPNEVIIHYTDNSAYLYKASLKVMLEQDYLKDSAAYNFKDERLRQLNEYSSQLIREQIIPKLSKEVNTAKRYCQLRQVFYSLALAQWFKDKFRGTRGQYARMINSMDLSGLSSLKEWSKTNYFNEYRESFQNGEYNLKEPVYGTMGQAIRSYTSGGFMGDTTGAQTAVRADFSLKGLLNHNSDFVDPDKGSRGFDGLPNDEYTEEIKKALEKNEFAACKYDFYKRKSFVQFSFYNDVQKKEVIWENQKIQLSLDQMEMFNRIISLMGFNEKLQNTTILFIKGKAHYGLGRNQIYLDADLLNNPHELKETLYHEVVEMQDVFKGLEELGFLEEFQHTALIPERREKIEVNIAGYFKGNLKGLIEKLAQESHNRLKYCVAPLSVDSLRNPDSIKEGKNWLIKNEYIFGGGYGYDIRINDAASEAEAAIKGFYVMGRALGKKLREDNMLGNPKALITGDQRGTSRALRLALVQGLFDEGIEITTQADNQAINTGLSSQKGLAEGFELVIQITGSHNPKQANGAKIMYESLPFYAHQLNTNAQEKKDKPEKYRNSLRYKIEEYGEFLENNINTHQGRPAIGRLNVDANLVRKHIEALGKVLPDLKNPSSVIADFRNGSGGEVFMGVAKEKGYRIVRFSSADASLPNEVFDSKGPLLMVLNSRPSPLMDSGIWDPSKPEAFEGIRKLQQRIYNDSRFQEKKFVGVVLDGDGDRSGAVTEGDKNSTGELIMPERMLISYFRRMVLENIDGIKVINRLGHTVKLALDVRSSEVIIDVLKELSEKHKIKVEGEFIAAGFPNHRAFVLEELTEISRLLRGHHELKPEQREAVNKLMLSYTSAEASGHFFFNVLLPEQFLDKKIVVDDGITSFFMYLRLVSTLDEYELAGQENISKTFAHADGLAPRHPVTDEVRLEKAPDAIDKKQKLAEEIMRQFIKDSPELLPMSLGDFEQKVGEARNSPPKRQSALEGLLLVDGIRLKLKNGVWILLRKSNTSAVIVFKAEAESEEKKFELLRVLRLLSQAINKVKDSSLDFRGLEIKKFTGEIERIEKVYGVIKEKSSSAITSADDFMVEIDYVMRMLKISDYSRIIQTFKTSVDPVALVDELGKQISIPIDNILTILSNNEFFSVLAASYRLRRSVSLDKSEYQGKNVSVDVHRWNYESSGFQDDVAAQPLSDYLALMRKAARKTPFVFRDNMEQFVGKFLDSIYSEKNFSAAHFLDPDLMSIINKVKEFLNTINLKKIKYVITSGIGANEMYSHQLASLLNNYFEAKGIGVRWIVVNNPAHLDSEIIPADAQSDNTIIFEMSRSGSTKETVDFFNATRSRFKQRIVAANVGALKKSAQELSQDNDARILIFDDIAGDIGGRQMNRKTLMVYAPLFVALASGFKNINKAEYYLAQYCDGLLSANKELSYKKGLESPSVRLAEFLLRQRSSGRNKLSVLYDNSLSASAKELFQLINEGANKNIAGGTNDNILVRYSLQDDGAQYNAVFSGMADSQVALFILNTESRDYDKHRSYIQNLEEKGLPCAIITVKLLVSRTNENGGEILSRNLHSLSFLSALLQDMVVYFTFITNQDANSNPAVKFVREITAAMFEIVKENKARGMADIRIRFSDVTNKIFQKKSIGLEEANKTISERGIKPNDNIQGLLNTQPALKELKDAIGTISKNLAISEADFISILLSTTSKDVLQTDVGEAGGSKISDIGAAFSRSDINTGLGTFSPSPEIIPLEEQIVLKQTPDMKISVAAAQQDDFPAAIENADIPNALADYFYQVYQTRGMKWQYMALSFMEADANNPFIKTLVTSITKSFAGLGIAVPLLPLPGVAHTGIEAVMSHPESVFNIAIMYTNAYGSDLGTRLVESDVTIDDATYVYGIANVIRMALGGTPTIIFEVKDKTALDSVKIILEAAVSKFKEKISSGNTSGSEVASSGITRKTGGVDLSHIGKVTQARLGRDVVDFIRNEAIRIDLREEDAYLIRLMDAGILALPQRVMNYVAGSSLQGTMRENAQDVLINYLRLQERFAVETSEEFKEFLGAIQPLWESNEVIDTDE